MARVNVFLKDDLLQAIDAEASASGINRSALCRGMDALAEKLGAWDPLQARERRLRTI